MVHKYAYSLYDLYLYTGWFIFSQPKYENDIFLMNKIENLFCVFFYFDTYKGTYYLHLIVYFTIK